MAIKVLYEPIKPNDIVCMNLQNAQDLISNWNGFIYQNVSIFLNDICKSVKYAHFIDAMKNQKSLCKMLFVLGFNRNSFIAFKKSM